MANHSFSPLLCSSAQVPLTCLGQAAEHTRQKPPVSAAEVPREESEVLNTATNNPILKNATLPNHVQLKALKALKKVRGYLAVDSHRIHHSTCHVLPQGKMALGELQLIQTVQGT